MIYTPPVQLIAKPIQQQHTQRKDISIMNNIPLGSCMYIMSLDNTQSHSCIVQGYKYHISNIQSDMTSSDIMIAIFNDNELNEYVQLRYINQYEAICIVDHKTLKPNINNNAKLIVQTYEQYRQQYIQSLQQVDYILQQQRQQRAATKKDKKRKRESLKRKETTDSNQDSNKKQRLCVIM